MATKKVTPDAKKSARPKLKSSHERVPPKPVARKPRAPAASSRPSGGRAAAPSAAKDRDRAPRSKRPKKEPTLPIQAPGSLASDASRDLAITIAISAIEKKAVGLEILDVAGRVDYADFLVLMTGRSDRQVASLAQAIEEALAKKGKRPLSVEGLPHANWVLMDFGDVVVHVFQEEARSLYDIEGLWMDARRIPVPLPVDVRGG